VSITKSSALPPLGLENKRNSIRSIAYGFPLVRYRPNRVMKRLILAVIVISLIGCAGSFQKRTTYTYSGLVVVTDTETAIRARCNGRRACYFPATKEAYAILGDQEALIHEACHYFCHEAIVTLEEQNACNVRCDTSEWERLTH
jgi:hypothetical protein